MKSQCRVCPSNAELDNRHFDVISLSASPKSSAKADYKLFLINRIFTFFISPLLISQVAISRAIYLFLHSVEIFNQNLFVNTPSSLIIALFTISLFIVDDFTKYCFRVELSMVSPFADIDPRLIRTACGIQVCMCFFHFLNNNLFTLTKKNSTKHTA